jgi:hypothetical protein
LSGRVVVGLFDVGGDAAAVGDPALRHRRMMAGCR